MQSCSDHTIVERIHGQGERVHLPVGALCNNNCQFCMESNREARAEAASQLTLERARWIMQQHRGAQEVCFTSGEPTTRPDLEKLIAAAHALDFSRISLMTNARRLSYAPYAARLVRAGLNRVYVSIHGDSALLHETLTRTPRSFLQTVRGIVNLANLRQAGVALNLNTSTVLTRRNVARLAEIYAFLRGLGVDNVVFNALQITGGAEKRFDVIVPRYAEVRRQFARVLEESGDKGAFAFLVDVPLCVTEGLPDRNRGFVERHLHYEASEQLMQVVHTSDLDQAFRRFGAPCVGCVYRGACPGVYKKYADRWGWDEFGNRKAE
jgi:molybdenum cofactor biosynthesis enzyme MoaA